MKLTRILLALVALAYGSTGWGQAGPFTKYGPAAGLQWSTGLTYTDTAATPVQVASVFCTTSTTNFLRADGTCAAPAGTTPSGTTNLVFATPNGSTGAATLRALVGADLPTINLGSTAAGGVLSTSILPSTNGGTSNGFFSVTGPATATRTFTFPNASATVLTSAAAVTVAQGGTGLATLTANGVAIGEGTSSPNFVALGADTVLRGTAAADPVAAAVPNCGSGTTALNYSTTTHAFGCQTITSGGTGTVTSVTAGTGLTGGTITSTGTIALDLTATNTWTGVQTFNAVAQFPAGFNGTFTGNNVVDGNLIANGTGTAVISELSAANGTDAIAIGMTGTGYTGSGPFSNNPTGTYGFIEGPTSTSRSLSIGVGNAERMRITGGGQITMNAPPSGNTLTVTAPASTVGFAGIFVSGTGATGTQDGLGVNAGTTSSDTAFIVNNQAGSNVMLKVDGAGSVYMPHLISTSAAQTGTICSGTGGILSIDTTVACLSSTIRVKRAVEPLDAGLAEVMKMRPVSYDLKPEFNPAHLGRQVGMIAEEIAAIDPRLVALDETGQPRGIRYMQTTAVLVKAIQEQQQQITALQAQLSRGHRRSH